MKHKALAYIIRNHDGQPELLTFTHKDFPEAGVQIPAGTVEPHESPATALFREIEEESGLQPHTVRLITKIAQTELPEQKVVRHIYLLFPAVELPDSWSHCVGGDGKDNGLLFDFRWNVLDITLAGGQGEWLHVAAGYCRALLHNNHSIEQP